MWVALTFVFGALFLVTGGLLLIAIDDAKTSEQTAKLLSGAIDNNRKCCRQWEARAQSAESKLAKIQKITKPE